MKTKNYLYALLISTGLVSCSDTLSEDELRVINNDLADELYKGNVESRYETVAEYLYDAVQVYSDQAGDDTQSEIDNYNAATAMWGGGDLGEILFGTSTTGVMARKYEKYIDYINSKLDYFTDDAEAITKIIKANPKLINTFYDGSESISLSAFNKIEDMPSSVSSDEIGQYLTLEQSKANRSQWGQLLMGTIKTPHYSPVALLGALVAGFERLKYPKAVYAVAKDYDDESGWEVGYDTSQAFFVTFEDQGDVLLYEYIPVDYTQSYINSENNQLK